MKIKVILWDLDGTLFNFKLAEKKSIQACFDKFGFGTVSDKMLADYSSVNRSYWEKLERGELSKQVILVKRFEDFFKSYGLDVSVAPEFNIEYQKALSHCAFLNPNAKETVSHLRGKVIQCAATNGTEVAQKNKLSEHGIGGLMDFVFISEIVGVEKPGEGFFNKIFQTIGPFEKKEIMIVGDSLTSDILGGVRAGIRTCYYNPNGTRPVTDLPIDYFISDLSQVEKIVGES